MYINRHIDAVLKKAGTQSKVVLLTGARQVGKSTTVQNVLKDCAYYTLDDENELLMAKTDRALFFKDKKLPIIIDEVQYAPELLKSIKFVVDAQKEKGQIFLTGSQRYELLSEAAESLSGRVSIIEMTGLSMREMSGDTFREAFIPTEQYIKDRGTKAKPIDDVWEMIHRGSMPELQDVERDWEWFYRDYVRTYIERDVRKIVNVKDELKFHNFLVSIASRSAQILVYEDIARDIGVDIKTVQHWLSVIAASGLIRIVHPYKNNAIQRAIKAPKLFFLDTGLLCYLIGWSTATTAKNGAMSGSIFETFVVSEILKSHMNDAKPLEKIYYYRDRDKKEIDLIIESDNTLYPIEIKKAATVDLRWVKPFAVLNKISDKKIANGTVVCQVDKPVPLSESGVAIPIHML